MSRRDFEASFAVFGDDSAEVSFAEQFTDLAPYYDRLMAHVPYGKWVDYLEKLFARHGGRPQRVVDLACGTGNVTFEMAKRGYATVGVDGSTGMLREARRKQAASASPVRFCQSDLRSLKLAEHFDAAVCLYDSLNYLTDPEGLTQAFEGVRSLLPEGGYYIFDVNAQYAFEAELFTQDNLRYGEDLKYLWKSSYNPTTRLCRVEMFFEIVEQGRPKRFREVHFERWHESEDIQRRLRDAGFLPIAEYEAYSFRRPRATSERLFFVAQAQ